MLLDPQRRRSRPPRGWLGAARNQKATMVYANVGNVLEYHRVVYSTKDVFYKNWKPYFDKAVAQTRYPNKTNQQSPSYRSAFATDPAAATSWARRPLPKLLLALLVEGQGLQHVTLQHPRWPRGKDVKKKTKKEEHDMTCVFPWGKCFLGLE